MIITLSARYCYHFCVPENPETKSMIRAKVITIILAQLLFGVSVRRPNNSLPRQDPRRFRNKRVVC